MNNELAIGNSRCKTSFGTKNSHCLSCDTSDFVESYLPRCVNEPFSTTKVPSLDANGVCIVGGYGGSVKCLNGEFIFSGNKASDWEKNEGYSFYPFGMTNRLVSAIWSRISKNCGDGKKIDPGYRNETCPISTDEACGVGGYGGFCKCLMAYGKYYRPANDTSNFRVLYCEGTSVKKLEAGMTVRLISSIWHLKKTNCNGPDLNELEEDGGDQEETQCDLNDPFMCCDYHYRNQFTMLCSNCPATCEKCVSSENGSCLKCRDGFTLSENGWCKKTCEDNEFHKMVEPYTGCRAYIDATYQDTTVEDFESDQ